MQPILFTQDLYRAKKLNKCYNENGEYQKKSGPK